MRKTKTQVVLWLDDRMWRWELEGNLTLAAIKDLTDEVEHLYHHTNRLLIVTRTPRWVDRATRIADGWLAWSPAVRFAAYFVAGAMLGVSIWLW